MGTDSWRVSAIIDTHGQARGTKKQDCRLRRKASASLRVAFTHGQARGTLRHIGYCRGQSTTFRRGEPQASRAFDDHLFCGPEDKRGGVSEGDRYRQQADDAEGAAGQRRQGPLMGLGYVEGVTHDYVRHGTTTLFAALDIASGRVLTRCAPMHRHQEFLQFLKQIQQNVPTHFDIHLVVDNYATHKHPKVHRWLTSRPRFHIHYTPTYASWLNQVEI